MKKKPILVALLIVALLAGAGVFALTEWAKAQVRAEIEKGFAGLRAKGADARFGDASVDLLGRMVIVTGISIADGTTKLYVDEIAAKVSDRPRNGRISAETVTVTGATAELGGPAAGGGRISYTIPRLVVDQYNGPAGVLPPDGKGGAFAGVRLALRQLAATSAGRVSVPQVTGRITPAAGAPDAAAVDLAYDGIHLEGLRGGAIARLSIDRIRHAEVPPAGAAAAAAALAPPALSSEVEALTASGIETAPLLAATSGEARDAGYQPLYRLVATGRLTLKEGDAAQVSIAASRIEDVAVKPAMLDLARLAELEALAARGHDLDAAQARRRVELSGDAARGIRFSRLALTDVSSRDEAGTARTGAVELSGFADGVLDSLALSAIAGGDTDGRQARIGSIAMRGLDFTRLVRLADTAGQVSPEAALEMFRLLSSLEMRDLDLPLAGEDGQPDTPFRIGTLAVSWGQFLGPAPTRLSVRLDDVSGAIGPASGLPLAALAQAGITRAQFSLSLDAAYDAVTRTVTAPLTMDVTDGFKLRFEGSVSGLPPTAFTESDAFAAALPLLTAGPVWLTLTEQGFVRTAMQQFAAADGISVDVFRDRLVAYVETQGQAYAGASPDVAPAVATVIAFLKAPGTLTVRARPKGRVPLLPLLEADNPWPLLQSFSITATATPP